MPYSIPVQFDPFGVAAILLQPAANYLLTALWENLTRVYETHFRRNERERFLEEGLVQNV